MRVRFLYTKEDDCRFLSHLDMMRLFSRTLRRGGVPVAYSGGFNPQPRIAFAAPLAVGTAGLEEYVDVVLEEERDVEELLETLNAQLPPEIALKAAARVPKEEGSLMALIDVMVYEIFLPQIPAGWTEETLEALKRAERVMVARKTKKGMVSRDIKPFILKADFVVLPGGGGRLDLSLHRGPTGSLRPEEVLQALKLPEDGRITRTGLYIRKGDRLLTPFEVMDGEVTYWTKKSS